jgi:hypothetical protein
LNDRLAGKPILFKNDLNILLSEAGQT